MERSLKEDICFSHMEEKKVAYGISISGFSVSNIDRSRADNGAAKYLPQPYLTAAYRRDLHYRLPLTAYRLTHSSLSRLYSVRTRERQPHVPPQRRCSQLGSGL
ncbi:hypothetical protein J6590_032813 [Homalodisca vitripennis]|nr:hypothetical protein J6590_032813 [Homalodisca vitripennis]